jgi:hypothetical protein
MKPVADRNVPYGKRFSIFDPTVAYNLGHFVCRRVRGSSTWSQHAFGTALDIGVRTIAAGEKVKDWLFQEIGVPASAPEPKPSEVTIDFPDVSKYRPVKDWDKLAGATKLLGVRVLGPSDKGAPDPTLQAHLKGCNEKGLFVLGYAFGWGDIPVGQQVDRFAQLFPVARNQLYIPVLDLENTPSQYGSDMSTDMARSFVADYARKVGFALGLYSTESWPRPGILSRMWRWVARFRTDPPGVPVGIGTSEMVAWQFTNGNDPVPRGFPGVAEKEPGCDVNHLYIPVESLWQLRRFWPGRYLEPNVRPGADIKRLQRKLGVPDSGAYDKATQDAVKKFQEAEKLQADSIVGFQSWRRIFHP